MTIPSRIPAAPSTEPVRTEAKPDVARPDFEIRFPALKGVIAGSAAARARKPLPKERDLPPILRKGTFED